MRKLLIAVLCVVLFASFSRPQTTTKTRGQFEYKYEYNCSEKKANELGADGWQLVAVESANGRVTGNVSTYVFKREK